MCTVGTKGLTRLVMLFKNIIFLSQSTKLSTMLKNYAFSLE